MTAAPKEQPKTSEAMANELTWYDAPLPYGVRMGARRPKYQGYGLPKGFPQSRLSDIDQCQETAHPCRSRAFREAVRAGALIKLGVIDPNADVAEPGVRASCHLLGRKGPGRMAPAHAQTTR